MFCFIQLVKYFCEGFINWYVHTLGGVLSVEWVVGYTYQWMLEWQLNWWFVRLSRVFGKAVFWRYSFTPVLYRFRFYLIVLCLISVTNESIFCFMCCGFFIVIPEVDNDDN